MKYAWAFLPLFVALACEPSGDEGVQALDFDPVEQVPAEEEARAYLEVVDSGDLDRAWDEHAGAFLRETRTQFTYREMVALMRRGTGAATERTLSSVMRAAQLQGAPPGDYFVFEFATEFEKTAGKERVVVSREAEGWGIASHAVEVPQSDFRP